MFFLKPTNKQIEQFLKRYGKYQVTDEEIQQYVENIQEQDKNSVTDQDINQFLQSQQGENVNINDVENFQLSEENKFKL